MKITYKFTAYKERDKVLKKMGFSTYKDYLKSELWSGIRKRVLERDRNHCRFCKNRKATTAHHKRYFWNDLNGITIKRIISVCHRCHYRLEFKKKEKGSLAEANLKFNDAMFERFRYAKEAERFLPKLSEFDFLCQDGTWPFLKQV